MEQRTLTYHPHAFNKALEAQGFDVQETESGFVAICGNVAIHVQKSGIAVFGPDEGLNKPVAILPKGE